MLMMMMTTFLQVGKHSEADQTHLITMSKMMMMMNVMIMMMMSKMMMTMNEMIMMTMMKTQQ